MEYPNIDTNPGLIRYDPKKPVEALFHFAPTVDPKKQARGLAPEPVKEREVTEGEGWRQAGKRSRSWSRSRRGHDDNGSDGDGEVERRRSSLRSLVDGTSDAREARRRDSLAAAAHHHYRRSTTGANDSGIGVLSSNGSSSGWRFLQGYQQERQQERGRQRGGGGGSARRERRQAAQPSDGGGEATVSMVRRLSPPAAAAMVGRGAIADAKARFLAGGTSSEEPEKKTILTAGVAPGSVRPGKVLDILDPGAQARLTLTPMALEATLHKMVQFLFQSR